MTDIKCPADCLFQVKGKCVCEEIELSYEDFGHMMCRAQIRRQVSGVEFGFSAVDICEMYPGMTSKEISILAGNKMAVDAMSDKQIKAICDLVNCLIENGR